MPKFNFNYGKSIFQFLIFCLWINNLTIIVTDRKVKQRWKGTYIEAGEFGEGDISK